MSAVRNFRLLDRVFISSLIVSIFVFTSGSVMGQTLGKRRCATDPTYKYFEEEQRREYEANPLAKERWLSPEAMQKSSEAVLRQLNERPNSIGFDPAISEEFSRNLDKQLAKLKLPTCYENPGMYLMLTYYVNEIDAARRQLKLPLKISPKYGSLPTNDINAYTYPENKESKRGSVIGFNVQLFMFAYQMLKVTLPTIEINQDSNSQKIKIDSSEQAAIRALSSAEVKTNFAMALLEFLQVTSPDTQPLDRKYDSLLLSLTQSIELFAVAHEYGHLIKGHNTGRTNHIRLLPLDEAPESAGSLVITRTWQQELEADNLGLQLVAQVLKNKLSQRGDELSRHAAQLRQLDSFFGALFFFKCIEILDQAKYVKKYGKRQSSLSTEEIEYIRALAEGRTTKEQQAKFASVVPEGHPPAWLRIERAIATMEQYLRQETITDEAQQYAQIALGLLRNVDLLWYANLPIFRTVIKTAQQGDLPVEVEYIQSPKLWLETFLYNPALNQAILKLINHAGTDDDITAEYTRAIKEDWLLLSGLQVRWAEQQITDGNTKNRKVALAVLGLSGDKQSLSALEKLDTRSWTEGDRDVLTKVEEFLKRNGRDTSIGALDRISASELKLADLLTFPAKLDQKSISNVVPSASAPEFTEFLTGNRGVLEGRSLSPMALYMLYAKTDPGTSYGFWSGLLLRAGNLDAALRYAQAGILIGGPSASLENDIGNILSEKGDLRGAIPHYESSLQLGRVDGWPEINMAKNYSELGELKLAEEWFRKGIGRRATVRSPREYARYLNEFAWFLVTKFKSDPGRFNEALTLSSQSNQIVRYSDPNYLDTLAECQAATGDIASAVKTSQAALALIPTDSPERRQYEKRLEEFKTRLVRP